MPKPAQKSGYENIPALEEGPKLRPQWWEKGAAPESSAGRGDAKAATSRDHAAKTAPTPKAGTMVTGPFFKTTLDPVVVKIDQER